MGDSDRLLPPILPTTINTTDPNPSPTTSKIPFRPASSPTTSPSSRPEAAATLDRRPTTPPSPEFSRCWPASSPYFPGEIDGALLHHRAADRLLGRLINAHGPVTFECLHPFHSLDRSILYQQLAFKATASISNRFIAVVGDDHAVLPDAVLALTPHQLRQIAVSARKAYLHNLASKYRGGILSDYSIATMDDRSLGHAHHGERDRRLVGAHVHDLLPPPA